MCCICCLKISKLSFEKLYRGRLDNGNFDAGLSNIPRTIMLMLPWICMYVLFVVDRMRAANVDDVHARRVVGRALQH